MEPDKCSLNDCRAHATVGRDAVHGLSTLPMLKHFSTPHDVWLGIMTFYSIQDAIYFIDSVEGQ